MTKTFSIERQLLDFPRPFATDSEIGWLIGGSPDRRYSKIKRLVASGVLTHIKRGLYSFLDPIGYPRKVHPFELVSFIKHPSMVSLESALSYHGLIPEAVYMTTAVTPRRNQRFHTPLGVFDYRHVPLRFFYDDVMRIVRDNGAVFFVASPWRALCDMVYCYKHDWTGIAPLEGSLRIECDELPPLTMEDVSRFKAYYGRGRVTQFLDGVVRDLGIT